MKMARMLVVVHTHTHTQGNLINEKTSMNNALLKMNLRRVNYVPVFFVFICF